MEIQGPSRNSKELQGIPWITRTFQDILEAWEIQ